MKNTCTEAAIADFPLFTEEQGDMISMVARKYPMRVTPYYLKLIMEPGDAWGIFGQPC